MSNVTKYQKFQMKTVHRSQIKLAKYNPRTIKKENAKRLKKNLSENGLVSTLVWNERTGNLVSGHQRIAALDALEHNKNYDITVAAVDLDAKQEAKLNVLMNNKDLQGDFDVNQLENMMKEFDFSLEDDFGFDESTIDFMTGGDENFGRAVDDTPAVKAEKAQIEDVREARKSGKKDMAEKNDANNYITVFFKTADDRKKFMRSLGLSEWETTISQEDLERIKA